MRPNFASLILLWAIPTISMASDYQWQASDFEVLFTNPTCPEKQFVSYRDPALDNRIEELFGLKLRDLPSTDVDLNEGIPTIGGGFRKTIAADTSCSRSDKSASVLPASENDLREKDSPYVRAFQWVNQALSGDSIFVASMSFSDPELSTALCEAAIRGASVKVFINSPNTRARAYTNLSECPVAEEQVTIIGYEKKSRLAHMKSIMVALNNPAHQDLKDKVRFSFQSGNISDGLWGHQENWNFVTLPRSHWAAQDHLCLRDTITTESMKNLGNWYQIMDRCRDERGINAVRRNDASFMNFFIPVSGSKEYDDKRVLANTLQEEVARASKIRIAAHHLTERKLMSALKNRLLTDKSFSLELILDDELAWSRLTYKGQDPIIDSSDNRYFAPSDFTKKCFWGKTKEKAEKECWSNKFSIQEYGPIYSELLANGAEIKFFEANHLAGLLFHHKFIIFEYTTPYKGFQGSVFTGAGNLSSSGFTKNFENYYLVRVNHVVEEFNRQYDDLKRKAVYESELPITWNYTASPISENEGGNGEDTDEGDSGENQSDTLEAGVKYEISLTGSNLPQDGSSLKSFIKGLDVLPSGSSVFKDSFRVEGSNVAIAVAPSQATQVDSLAAAIEAAGATLVAIEKI